MVYFYNIQHCHCCIISIAAFFLSCIHWRRKEPTSLSYMYGPDHELSNLRDAYRHAHANNPHYTWFVFNSCMIMILCWPINFVFIQCLLLRSRDDYVCTDEDIELLNKFPRQYLKLET